MDDHTPNTGVVLFKDSDGEERTADFLSAPYGLDARDVRDSALRIVVPDPDGSGEVPVWIMHPERCLGSRVFNVVGLKQAGQIAMEQLQRSVLSAREFSRQLLDDTNLGEAGGRSPRDEATPGSRAPPNSLTASAAPLSHVGYPAD
jgi:hypothetical protein